jgi:outer membrane protein
MRSTLLIGALLWPMAASAAPLTLLDIYARAVEEDPRVNIAELQVELSEAQKDSARSQLLPQGSATAQISENDLKFDRAINPNEQYPGERYGIQIRQMLFNWSAISARSRAASVVDQRENELLDTMAQLSVDVAERYFNVLLADDDVRLLEAEQNLVTQQLDETRARYQRELVPVTELLEIQSRVDQVRTDLIDARNNAAIAREELALLTGAPVGEIAPLRADAQLPEIGETLDYWLQQARTQNPQLLARRDAVAAARKGVEESRGQYIPSASFVLSGQRSDVGFDNLQSPQRDVVYVGVDINVPLFAGGGFRSRMRESWSQFYIAREEEEGALREVTRRVRGAWLNARAGRARVDAANATVESASTAYAAMRKAFTLGGVRGADVLEALHRRTRAERDRQQAIYGYLFHWISLQREAGEVDADDMRLLNEQVVQ